MDSGINPESIRNYAICFDFPEADDPVFAGRLGAGEPMGFAPTLATAEKWDSELVAERVLRNSYGTLVAEFGVVVEVDG